MALEDIIKKIKKETEEKIKEIKERSKKEIEKIEEEYKKEIEKKKKEILDLAKENEEKRIESCRIQLSMETKNLLLKKKNEILDEVYNKVLEKLSSLNENDYLKLILNLLKDCPENGEIIPAKGKEKIIQKAILESRKKIRLSHQSLPIKGGFIFTSEDLEIDNSFENLIKIIREKTEIEVAKILFD